MTTRLPLVAQALTRLGGLGLLATLLAHVRIDGRPPTLCTLRAFTGVPCPFCGGTTAAVHLGEGDVHGALAASPLAVLSAPLLAAMPVLRARLHELPRYAAVVALGAALVTSEVWQLHRFGWL